jgi:hypothetical protein
LMVLWYTFVPSGAVTDGVTTLPNPCDDGQHTVAGLLNFAGQPPTVMHAVVRLDSKFSAKITAAYRATHS